jgi:hypothetical protein
MTREPFTGPTTGSGVFAEREWKREMKIGRRRKSRGIFNDK